MRRRSVWCRCGTTRWTRSKRRYSLSRSTRSCSTYRLITFRSGCARSRAPAGPLQDPGGHDPSPRLTEGRSRLTRRGRSRRQLGSSPTGEKSRRGTHAWPGDLPRPCGGRVHGLAGRRPGLHAIAQLDHALETKEFSRLEPGVIEHKFYVSGVGACATRPSGAVSKVSGSCRSPTNPGGDAHHRLHRDSPRRLSRLTSPTTLLWGTPPARSNAEVRCPSRPRRRDLPTPRRAHVDTLAP
jgi:hypothetical protein